jgi:hypothetical protein
MRGLTDIERDALVRLGACLPCESQPPHRLTRRPAFVPLLEALRERGLIVGDPCRYSPPLRHPRLTALGREALALDAAARGLP